MIVVILTMMAMMMMIIPMYFTLVGIVTDVKEEHPSKTFCAYDNDSDVMLGLVLMMLMMMMMMMMVMMMIPILVTLVGKVMDVNDVHLLKT